MSELYQRCKAIVESGIKDNSTLLSVSDCQLVIDLHDQREAKENCFSNKGDSEANMQADMQQEELLEALSSVGNFIRGATMDPSMTSSMREAFISRLADIDSIVDKYV